MDTRRKIADKAKAMRLPTADQQPLYVVGWFDPMLAWHASRLEELAAQGRPVVVVIDDPPDAILAAGARAELAASLACVSGVVLAAHCDARGEPAVDLRAAENEARDDLAVQVGRRQGRR